MFYDKSIFPPITLMSSIDIMDRDDTTRIVFKVALNTHKHNSVCENCCLFWGSGTL